MARRNANGEGTIYRRKDGRYEGALYVSTTTGMRKRVRVYGATRAEVDRKFTEAKAKSHQGIPAPDKVWKLNDYLDYWLEEVVKKNAKPKTYEQYESVTRLYLKPNLGSRSLTGVRVQTVRSLLNYLLEQGHSPRRVQTVKTTLSAALTHGMREELVSRNVARLAESPSYKPKRVVPWTVDEAKRFWNVAREHRLAAAWGLAVFYGPRRGEILGLRWQDVDLIGGEIRLTQQLQTVGGKLVLVSLKTDSSERPLPILNVLKEGLARMSEERKLRQTLGSDLVFTTPKGTPVDPRNFADKMFKRLCKVAGVRVIKFHHTRHTAASMLEFLGVSPKVAQAIFGHSSVITTQQYYQHAYSEQIESALRLVEKTLQQPKTAQSNEAGRLVAVLDGNGSRQNSRQSHVLSGSISWIISGGTTGARTQDTLLKRSSGSSTPQRVTEVDRILLGSRRRWLLGVVAVSVAVKTTQPNDFDLAT
ncbi:tyrosine-type recombinase/integrase [Streptomyces sp. P11-1]|uniref:tyrosine-type recombinase/integrase n=1 Tax=Streptomyces sp. P11-1 TaxID=3423221 RepID=UPI003D2ED60C